MALLEPGNSWTGWPHNPVAQYGESTNLYVAETVIRTFVDDFGDTVTQQTFEAGDTIFLGTVRLAGNALTFTGTGVPSSATASSRVDVWCRLDGHVACFTP